MTVRFLPFEALGILALVVGTNAWGQVGHQIVATIAQTQLHPLVRAHLCDILPAFTAYQSAWPANGPGGGQHCHLAPLAAWPDAIRFRFPWSGHLHYVNPLNDTPPEHCTYGEQGWTSDENVLSALVNYTSQVATKSGQTRDYALRFLTHFVGDAHQPLHLTGRARGGNDIWVHFEGRAAKLHSVWDSLIINSQIRNLGNYTTPLPSSRIESALRGTTYDAYIRWILAEGLGSGGWWVEEWAGWATCPARDALPGVGLKKRDQRVFAELAEIAFGEEKRDPSEVDDTDLPICPYAWTRPLHPFVCEYAFAPPVPPPESDELDANAMLERGNEDEDEVGMYRGRDLPELDTEEYMGRVNSDKVIQKQLAMAGVRLAAVLNSLLLPEAEANVEAEAKARRSQAGVGSVVGSSL